MPWIKWIKGFKAEKRWIAGGFCRGFTNWMDSMSQPQAKPLRQTMPTVAAWVDELREAFGADAINPAIRNGVAGGAAFYATEGGHTIGSAAIPGKRVLRLSEITLPPPLKESAR